jgi:uncharacterized protein YegP (UPF0339 family)
MYIEVLKDLVFFWWRLKGKNHQILATSEGYDTPSNARRAAKKVGKDLNLKVVDRTK